MLTQVFVNVSLLGAEWVLWLLIALSIVSISLIFDRWFFYQKALKGLPEFREKVRQMIAAGQLDEARKFAEVYLANKPKQMRDFESAVILDLLRHVEKSPEKTSVEILNEVAQDSLLQTRLKWDRNLAVLATIGNNAPFIGLFGTVLGIIQAFHDLSQQTAEGAQRITSGLSEALVATAIGIFVALPAVAAFNFFQRKIKSSLTEGESLKGLIIGKLAKTE